MLKLCISSLVDVLNIRWVQDIYLSREYLLKVIHSRVYTAKARLLHLPDRFSRKLPIKLVDEQRPSRRLSTQGHSPQGVYGKSASTSSTGPF